MSALIDDVESPERNEASSTTAASMATSKATTGTELRRGPTLSGAEEGESEDMVVEGEWLICMHQPGITNQRRFVTER
jgi:hypothetical protein